MHEDLDQTSPDTTAAHHDESATPPARSGDRLTPKLRGVLAAVGSVLAATALIVGTNSVLAQTENPHFRAMPNWNDKLSFDPYRNVDAAKAVANLIGEGAVKFEHRITIDGVNLTTVAEGRFDGACTETSRQVLSLSTTGSFEERWQAARSEQRITIDVDADTPRPVTVSGATNTLEPAFRIADRPGYCEALKALPGITRPGENGSFVYDPDQGGRNQGPSYEIRINEGIDQLSPQRSLGVDRIMRFETTATGGRALNVYNAKGVLVEQFVVENL